jgi:oxygen-independent coproporphyrinogen-3 oxidase
VRDRMTELLSRYAEAGPRYTSYPTAPVWTPEVGPGAFGRSLERLEERASLALYVHVPFCRSLCHFCACNRVVTRRPELPRRYLGAIECEARLLAERLGTGRVVSEMHWGGGTPTHLEPGQIERLFATLARAFGVDERTACSIEVDPRVTTVDHVDALASLGFRRISMGVQDFDPRVQAAIHRIQDVETTERLIQRCRAQGFESVGIDLIYGLPFQHAASFEKTLDAVARLRADRIALYSYAHVTWVAKQQRAFERHDLPSDGEKLGLFVQALERLEKEGYVHLGMDHFALPEDSLAVAAARGELHRNFMGYTTAPAEALVGLGPSAISELPDLYAQSQRDLEGWCEAVEGGQLATQRGHAMSADDLERRWLIESIMCRGGIAADAYARRFGGSLAARHEDALRALRGLAADGLVELEPDGSLRVTAIGRLFLRNVAMPFDAYLPEQRRSGRRIFSRTV